MTDDDRAGDGKVEVVDGPFTSRFFPMRHAGKRRDPTLQDLNKIRCSSALGRTQVNVSMFYWKGTRGNYLLDKLLSLSRSGCHVSIIYGAPSVQIAERLRDAARIHRRRPVGQPVGLQQQRRDRDPHPREVRPREGHLRRRPSRRRW